MSESEYNKRRDELQEILADNEPGGTVYEFAMSDLLKLESDHASGKFDEKKLVKIVGTTMYWMDGYTNYPDLRVEVDLEGRPLEFVYDKKGCTYFAEDRGVAEFFYYSAPGQGYGGRTFELNMKDGSTAKLVGPWSSNTKAVHDAGFPLTVSCAYREKDSNLSVFCSCNLTIELAVEACKAFNASSPERKIGLALVNHYSSRDTGCIFIEFVEVKDGQFLLKGDDAKVVETYYMPED